MEPHISRSHGHHYGVEPHTAGGMRSVVEGEDEPHHEKKSVLKKVKDKAKKIKETLAKHGHGHDEEEDEDEDMGEDPEVHGAPTMHESAAGRSGVGGQEVDSGLPRGNLERPSVIAEDRYDSDITAPPVRPFGEKQQEILGQTKVKIGEQTGMEEDPHTPKDPSQAFDPSNYQTKVADPTGTGGEEAGINPILTSFNKMNVHDEPAPKPKSGPEQMLSTGSHDQFSPEPIPSNTTTTNPENPESLPKSFDASKREDMPRDKLTGVISSVTSAIADKASSAKTIVASKLGYAGGGNEDVGGGNATKSSASPTEYAHKIAGTVTEKLAPAYGKVAGAGSTVMSKVQGCGTGQEGEDKKGPDKGISVKEYLAVKFRPSEEDRALSEVISGTLRKPQEGSQKTEGYRPISEVVSDALQKRNDEAENEGETKAVGKVTESEEVAKRLGTGIEDPREGGDATKFGTEKGTVDWLKGTVNAWLGRGGETQTSQGTTTSGEGHDEDVFSRKMI